MIRRLWEWLTGSDWSPPEESDEELGDPVDEGDDLYDYLYDED